MQGLSDELIREIAQRKRVRESPRPVPSAKIKVAKVVNDAEWQPSQRDVWLFPERFEVLRAFWNGVRQVYIGKTKQQVSIHVRIPHGFDGVVVGRWSDGTGTGIHNRYFVESVTVCEAQTKVVQNVGGEAFTFPSEVSSKIGHVSVHFLSRKKNVECQLPSWLGEMLGPLEAVGLHYLGNARLDFATFEGLRLLGFGMEQREALVNTNDPLRIPYFVHKFGPK